LGLLQGWLDVEAMVILLSCPEIGCLQNNQNGYQRSNQPFLSKIIPLFPNWQNE
jgi:hypothetical protein